MVEGGPLTLYENINSGHPGSEGEWWGEQGKNHLKTALARHGRALEPSFVSQGLHGPFICRITLLDHMEDVQGYGKTKKVSERVAVDAACLALDKAGILKGRALTPDELALMAAQKGGGKVVAAEGTAAIPTPIRDAQDPRHPPHGAERRGNTGGGGGPQQQVIGVKKAQTAIRRECENGNVVGALQAWDFFRQHYTTVVPEFTTLQMLLTVPLCLSHNASMLTTVAASTFCRL